MTGGRETPLCHAGSTHNIYVGYQYSRESHVSPYHPSQYSVMASNRDFVLLEKAMSWPENDEQVFHIDAFNLGRSLMPLLNLRFDDTSKLF